MRGIRKPWSPRDVSPDGQMPRTWKQAEAEFLNELPLAEDRAGCARATFDAMEKRKLRAVLYQEQGKLCVYCERRLDEGSPPPRIDHWRPLRTTPALALHWHNVYLSCADKKTCDSRKSGTPLRAEPTDADLPWPVNHAYERCVGYTSLGEAYVRTDAPLTDAQRRTLVFALGNPHNDVTKDNGILNLNHPALVAARNAALDSERTRLERDYKSKTASRTDRETRATELLKEKPLKDFISIRLQWLERSLGKAR